MDKFGIGVAILSLTQVGDVIYDNTEKGRSAVRTVNEFGAKCMQDYPKRFGLFASIPFPDVEGSLKEIAYAYDTLKCDGISIYTNDNQGHWPGEKIFKLNALPFEKPWEEQVYCVPSEEYKFNRLIRDEASENVK